jgi:hypothetical protein
MMLSEAERGLTARHDAEVLFTFLFGGKSLIVIRAHLAGGACHVVSHLRALVGSYVHGDEGMSPCISWKFDFELLGGLAHDLVDRGDTATKIAFSIPSPLYSCLRIGGHGEDARFAALCPSFRFADPDGVLINQHTFFGLFHYASYLFASDSAHV